jgi:hypothetical protein
MVIWYCKYGFEYICTRGGLTWYSMVFIEYQSFLEKTGYIYI